MSFINHQHYPNASQRGGSHQYAALPPQPFFLSAFHQLQRGPLRREGHHPIIDHRDTYSPAFPFLSPLISRSFLSVKPRWAVHALNSMATTNSGGETTISTTMRRLSLWAEFPSHSYYTLSAGHACHQMAAAAATRLSPVPFRRPRTIPGWRSAMMAVIGV